MEEIVIRCHLPSPAAPRRLQTPVLDKLVNTASLFPLGKKVVAQHSNLLQSASVSHGILTSGLGLYD